MNLVIDIGNSRVKTGIFVKGNLVKNNAYETFNLSVLKSIFRDSPGIKNSILCSVKKYPPALKHFLSSHSRFLELTPKMPVPVKVGYKTPLTLGMDRLAAICGAFAISQKRQSILIVNAGTCLTYDFMDSRGVYKGGAISPGLEMRYKALHTFTAGLPLIVPDMDFKKLTGETTEESIRAGVQKGIIKEVEGMMREYRSKYKNLKIILTGGAVPWLLKSLKPKIKAEPFLVLTGLNVILSFFHDQRQPYTSK